MTVDSFLCQYRILLRRIEERTARLKRMNAQLDSITSVCGEHLSAHTTDAPYVHLIERMETIREELRADENLLPYLQEQVMDLIYSVPGEKMVQVLVHRYLDGLTYRKIGDLMYMDGATAKRWQTRALALLSVPENPVLIGD